MGSLAVPADLAGNVTGFAGQVRDKVAADDPWLQQLLERDWGGGIMVVRGEPVEATSLPARIYGSCEGLALFRYEPEPELVLLQAMRRRAGIGSALLRDVIAKVRKRGGRSLIAMTTNDNAAALAFYAKHAFYIRQIYAGAVERARLIKPSIPKTNAGGDPISDEIELALQF